MEREKPSVPARNRHGRVYNSRICSRDRTKSYVVPDGTPLVMVRLPSVETLGLDILSPSGTAESWIQ
jgi:hypothetical protein